MTVPPRLPLSAPVPSRLTHSRTFLPLRRYGSGPVEMALVDQLMDGCSDMRPKIIPLIYFDSMQVRRVVGLPAGRARGWRRQHDPRHHHPSQLSAHALIPPPSPPLPAWQTDEARQAHWDTHVDPESARGACRGAHNLFLQNQIQKHGKVGVMPFVGAFHAATLPPMPCTHPPHPSPKCPLHVAAHPSPPQDGFAVGSKLTIVDLYLFDLTDAHHRVFGAEKFNAVYPAVGAHHAKIAALPAVAAYLASPLRSAK